MRKKILGRAVMAVVAVAAAWNINQSENEIKLSDLALDNVEALASGEGGSGYCSYSGGRMYYQIFRWDIHLHTGTLELKFNQRRVCQNEKNHNGIQSVNQWNADVFSLIFNLYFIDSRYLEQEENVFNPLIWHALLKKSVS